MADYLPSAKNVYLVQATSVDRNKATFTVTEVLRGKAVLNLTLEIYPGGESYTPKSEWLLVSCTPHGLSHASVGWAMKGDCGWIPAKVVRQTGKIYIVDWTSRISAVEKEPFGIKWDVTPDGVRCLTLDHVKLILQQTPKKP